jgi:phage I-like protein
VEAFNAFAAQLPQIGTSKTREAAPATPDGRVIGTGTLTAEEIAVCRQTGKSEAAFLAPKTGAAPATA